MDFIILEVILRHFLIEKYQIAFLKIVIGLLFIAELSRWSTVPKPPNKTVQKLH